MKFLKFLAMVDEVWDDVEKRAGVNGKR